MDFVLPVVFAAIFFYVLYCVVKAATRDGILAARKALRAEAGAKSPSAERG